ncbi:MBL fold metallo-hydrolase [Halobacteriales archaeon Cl-PHB]
MTLGEVYEATAGDSTDLYYVDTEMYDTPEYGSIYILDADRPALVDTGIGRHPDVILEAMAEVGIDPADLVAIVPTHVHLDHAGGAGYLVEECPNAEVCVHEAGARHLVDPERLWEGTKKAVGDEIQFYGEPRPVPEDRLTEISGGDTIDLGDHALEVFDAPGHAPHQAVFYDPANDGVFTADAAGIMTPGLDDVHPATAPPNFHLEQCLADVETIRSLDPEALYYGHFGDWETADRLAAYETNLGEFVESVVAAREELADDEAVVERFVTHPKTAAAWGEQKATSEMAMNVRGVLTYLDKHR